MNSTTNFETDSKLYANKLRFPDMLEMEYRQFNYRKLSRAIRAYFFGAIMVWCLFAILDYYAMPLTYRFAWGLRLILIFIFIIILWTSNLPIFEYWLPEVMLSFTCLGGLMIVAMTANSEPTELAHTYYPIGILLVMVATYAVSAPLLEAVIGNGLLALAYILVGILVQHSLDTAETARPFFVMVFFMVGMNWMTAMLGYLLEISSRREFLQRRIIEQQRLEADSLREQADNLLLNILPTDIATTLKSEQHIIADYHENASILFADVVNFTPMSASMTPAELVELLHQVFSRFDALVEKYGLEKIKTIGDCYMVAAGIPHPRVDHAQAITRLALDMQELVRQKFFSGKQLSFRIGINSGPVVAGVIGQKKFAYDLWGDAVNTASRMESHGVGGLIQITEATYEIIKNDFRCDAQGLIEVKGKGRIPVWHVLGTLH